MFGVKEYLLLAAFKLQESWNQWVPGFLLFIIFAMGEIWHLNGGRGPDHQFPCGYFYLSNDYYILFRNAAYSRLLVILTAIIIARHWHKRHTGYIVNYTTYVILDIALFHWNGNTIYEGYIYIAAGLAEIILLVRNFILIMKDKTS